MYWYLFLLSSLNSPVAVGTPYNGLCAYAKGSARKGYLFQASGLWKGRDFTSWSLWKGKEICHSGLRKEAQRG